MCLITLFLFYNFQYPAMTINEHKSIVTIAYTTNKDDQNVVSKLYLPAKCLFAIAIKYTTSILVTVNPLLIH